MLLTNSKFSGKLYEGKFRSSDRPSGSTKGGLNCTLS